MAQLNVRFPDAFYKLVQRIVYDHLEMDLSSFVRELFIDTILVYEGESPLNVKALAAIGQTHRIKGGPGLVLALADRWRSVEEIAQWIEEEPTELEKKIWAMPPEELKDYFRQQGKDEKFIESVVGDMKMSLKERMESLANDPELARIDEMTEEESEKYLMESARAKMIKAKQRRRAAMRAEGKLKGEKT